MKLTEAQRVTVTADLMKKIGDDTGSAILRVLSVAPEPHLPLVIAALGAGLGIAARVLDTAPNPEAPDPDCVLLGALLAAYMATKQPNSVRTAYAALELLKSPAGLSALSETEER